MKALVFAQVPAAAHVFAARLVQADDAVHAARMEFAHQRIGTEACVSHHHVAAFDEVRDLVPQAQVMLHAAAQRPAEPRAG